MHSGREIPQIPDTQVAPSEPVSVVAAAAPAAITAGVAGSPGGGGGGGPEGGVSGGVAGRFQAVRGRDERAKLGPWLGF